MEYIYLISSSVIILACFYFIVSPFFTTKGKGTVWSKENEEENLTLEAVYGAVNELEMDYLMKKIKEVDYQNLKEQYQLLAAGMMKQGEKQKKTKGKPSTDVDKVELEILTELQKIRKQKGR